MDKIEYKIIPVYSRLVAGHNRYSPGFSVVRSSGTNDFVVQMTLEGCGYFSGASKGGANQLGANETTALPAGSIAIIPPGTPHDYGAHPEHQFWDVVWIHFHPREHWERLMKQPPLASGLIMINMDDSYIAECARKAFLETVKASVSRAAHRVMWAMNALERGLLYCNQLAPQSASAAGDLDRRVEKAIDFMLEHLGEPLTVADIAAAAGLSPSRFAHLFRASLNTPPLRYLEQQRLDRARDLLARTAQPVAQIAEELGFADPFYFSRRFQKANGLSPREFRKRATS